MTYIKDGTNEDYHRSTGNFFAWGWLSSDHEFTTGWNSVEEKAEFIKLVNSLDVVDLYRGFHCDDGLGLKYGVTPCPNGSRKFTVDGITYTAPNCVSYYIEKLDYLPPIQVREAIKMIEIK